MKNIIIRLLGLNALVFFGDPPAFDRFIWLKRHLKKGHLRTLDAGCGSGTFTIFSAQIGNEAIGISFDKRNNEVARARARAKALRLENIKFIDLDLRKISEISNEVGLFDQLICFETIEHIMDDRNLVYNFSCLLKPGGRLLLTTPYKYYHHLLTDKISDKEEGDHVRWGYTHDEIRNIFKENGLEIELEEYISGFISQQLCNLERLLSFIIGRFSYFVVFPLRLLTFFDPLLTKILNYPYLSIGVIGVKHH